MLRAADGLRPKTHIFHYVIDLFFSINFVSCLLSLLLNFQHYHRITLWISSTLCYLQAYE